MRLDTFGDGPLVVKLAGLVGGVGLYREEIGVAARAGFRIAALDTSGDRADDPAPGRLSWDFLAGETTSALDRLETDRAILWGTSFGCLVALAAAARSPDRVAGLLLCHPPDAAWRPRLYRSLLAWASGRPEAAATTARLFRVGFPLLAGWEFVSVKALRRLPALAREAADAATPDATIAEKLGLMWNEDPGLPPAPARIPATILVGAWDTVTPPALARRLALRLPGSEVRVLAFSGHAGAYSRPATYTRMAVEELRRLAGVSPRPGVDPGRGEKDTYGQAP